MEEKPSDVNNNSTVLPTNSTISDPVAMTTQTKTQLARRNTVDMLSSPQRRTSEPLPADSPSKLSIRRQTLVAEYTNRKELREEDYGLPVEGSKTCSLQ